jgi:glycosyltransferase involved in cell wall biosynthesis
MKKIKFSICIPNFNYGHFIDKTIQSVLNQSYENFEIIICDNASTDDSLNIIKSFSDNRIRLYVNQINLGFSANLDKATQHATGDYFILLSSDDIMNEEALNEYFKIITEYNGMVDPLVIMSGANVIDVNGNVIGWKKAKTGDVEKYLSLNKELNYSDPNKVVEIYSGHALLKGLLLGNFQPAGQFLTTCYSRLLYDKVEGYRSPLSIFPDAHFSHKLLFCNPKVVYLNKYLFSYRVHSSSNYSQQLRMINLYGLLDNYLLTQLYSTAELSKIVLSKDQLSKAFVDNIIGVSAFVSFLRGKFTNTFRLFSFGYAAFPSLFWKSKYPYFTIIILPFFPIVILYNILDRNFNLTKSE